MVCKDTTVDDSFGYVEPGHGAKGKHQKLMTIEDLRNMYKVYEGRKEILLWSCSERRDQLQRKHPHTSECDDELSKCSRYDKYLDKMKQ